MQNATTSAPLEHDPMDPAAADFYRRAMASLHEAGVPFLVGGAYALARYTGIARHTKDFDVFLKREDLDLALAALEGDGLEVVRPFPHWLAKAYEGDLFVDLIYSSGNGIARVDERWFEHAEEGEVLGVPALLCPAEEIIWSKSFIMERERYDGGDVAHLLRCRGPVLDWNRLLERFAGADARVLLAHAVLFGYIYPGERGQVPRWVMGELLARVAADQAADQAAGQGSGAPEKLCRGPILSRLQYLVDVEEWGYRDARRQPLGRMSDEELERWTEAAREEEAKRQG
jgi:hypothetical protein